MTKCIFFAFFCKKIWLCQKNVVPLHPLLKNNSNALPNCVMVALQILVLSVWVRVLVRQLKKSPFRETFFCALLNS